LKLHVKAGGKPLEIALCFLGGPADFGFEPVPLLADLVSSLRTAALMSLSILATVVLKPVFSSLRSARMATTLTSITSIVLTGTSSYSSFNARAVLAHRRGSHSRDARIICALMDIVYVHESTNRDSKCVAHDRLRATATPFALISARGNQEI
jgi:hypothetical protein